MPGQKFWCEVFWRSTECVGCLIVIHVELAETEVAQRDVSSVVEENILGLEIAVDHVEAVKVLQSEQKLGSIEARAGLVELALALQVVEQLSSVDEREDQVQLLLRLE